MAHIENDLAAILKGAAITCETVVLGSNSSDDYVPITKSTVTYIVAAVIFNDAGEVLLMQEAKLSCYEQWYLPAGRLELDETIEEGAIREVLEETGLMFEPSTLLCVEAYWNRSPWYRFTFTGRVIGGELKSVQKKDSESLQASWFPLDKIKAGNLPLRCKDILKLIDIGVSYKLTKVKRADLRPSLHPYNSIIIRLVIAHMTADRGHTSVLISTVTKEMLPSFTQTNRTRSLLDGIAIVLKRACGPIGVESLSGTSISVLSVEHSGKPSALHDGLCLTILIPLHSQFPVLETSADSYMWLSLQQSDLIQDLVKMIEYSNSKNGVMLLL